MLSNFSDLLAVSVSRFLCDSESSSAISFTRRDEAPQPSLRKSHRLTQSTLLFLLPLFEMFTHAKQQKET